MVAFAAAMVALFESIAMVAYGIWTPAADFVFYRGLGERWLIDGSYYLPRQLAGPYEGGLLGFSPIVDTLYPPHALLLFVPFTLLPSVLWWAIPVGVTAYIIWGWRPDERAEALMMALLIWPRANGAFVYGNTDIWMMAGIAAGLRWGWPVLVISMKPTLAPFALLGVRHRSWWLAAALGLVVVVLSWPLWMDYATAMRNLRGIDLGYNLLSLPLMLVPVVAWWARTRPS
jgi:hypothetical protein